MSYFNNPLGLYTTARVWSGGGGYAKSAFTTVESEFPYRFFGGLIATIGFCLFSWAGYAKNQQAIAIADCINAEIIETEQIAAEVTFNPKDMINRTESVPMNPEARLDRASRICNMKCIRGSLSGCP